MMVRQAFDATFRELEALLTLLADFFRIKKVPNASTLSEKYRFGHMIRCRTRLGKHNEVRAREIAHNIRVLSIRDILSTN